MSINLLITPKTIDFCGNGLAFKVQGTQFIPAMDDFKILVELYLVHSDGTFELANSFDFDVDSQGLVEFRLGRVLASYIESSLPVLGTVDWFFQAIQKYKLVVREFSEHPNFSTLVPSFFDAYAINGKLKITEFPEYNFVQKIINQKTFLNNKHDIETWPDKHYYLYFYNPHQSSELCQVNVKIFYTDFSTYDATMNVLNFYPATKGIYGFPCSIAAWDLNKYHPEKDIYKYKLGVLHADNTTLCYKKTFLVREKPMFVREFCFINKFGVPEFFHASSKSTTKLITKKKVSKRELPVGYSLPAKEYFERLESAHNEIDITSGNITKDSALFLQDALFSEEFWEIENNQYIPCIINEGTFEIIPESETIVSIKFSYRRAFDS